MHFCVKIQLVKQIPFSVTCNVWRTLQTITWMHGKSHGKREVVRITGDARGGHITNNSITPHFKVRKQYKVKEMINV